MEASYKFKVVTPDGVIFEGDVVSIVVPGVDGYLGVLAHHAPMVAAVDVGELSLRLPDGKIRHVAVSAGFLEVKTDEVDLYVDAAEFREEIDLSRAKAAEDRAMQRLTEMTEGTDVERAKTALKRALNRIRVAEK